MEACFGAEHMTPSRHFSVSPTDSMPVQTNGDYFRQLEDSLHVLNV